MSCMNQTIHLGEEKHHKVAGVDLLFLSAGIPWGIQLETNQIKQVKENIGRGSVGNKLPRITWLHTFVLLDKNTLNYWLNQRSGSLTN